MAFVISGRERYGYCDGVVIGVAEWYGRIQGDQAHAELNRTILRPGVEQYQTGNYDHVRTVGDQTALHRLDVSLLDATFGKKKTSGAIDHLVRRRCMDVESDGVCIQQLA